MDTRLDSVAMDDMNSKLPEEKQQIASRLVRNYALGSAVTALIPSPLLDLAALTAVQLKMLHSLARVYNIEFREELGRSAIVALVGGMVPLGSSRFVASLVKLVPVVGTVIATLTLPALSTASTYAIGRVFMQHFESGGTFLNFDPEQVRQHYTDQLQKGYRLHDGKSDL